MTCPITICIIAFPFLFLILFYLIFGFEKKRKETFETLLRFLSSFWFFIVQCGVTVDACLPTCLWGKRKKRVGVRVIEAEQACLPHSFFRHLLLSPTTGLGGDHPPHLTKGKQLTGQSPPLHTTHHHTYWAGREHSLPISQRFTLLPRQPCLPCSLTLGWVGKCVSM